MRSPLRTHAFRRLGPVVSGCRFLLLAGIAWATLGAELPGLEPSQRLTQFNCRSWTQDDGLPADAIHGITVTPDDRLWLATTRGLVHFDGLDFHLHEPPPGSPYAGRVFASLAASPAGGLWFGMESSGLGFFDGRAFEAVPLDSEVLAKRTVRTLAVPAPGTVLAGGIGGLARVLRDGRTEHLLSAGGVDIFSLTVDPEGILWAGTADNGIYRRGDDGWHAFADPSLQQVIVNALAFDLQGRLWVGTSRDLRLYTADGRRLPLPRDFPAITSIWIDPDGPVWLGSYGGGLFRIADGEVSQLRAEEGLASNQVLSLQPGPHGSLWIGTDSGLSQLFPYRFPTFSDREGLPHRAALAVEAHRERGLWIGTPTGIALLDEDRVEVYGTPESEDGFGSPWVKYLYHAKDGALYCIGSHKNLDRFVGGRVRESWTFAEWPQCLAEDSEGLILAVGGDLLRRRAGHWVPLLGANDRPIALPWISDLLVTPDGALWIATGEGLLELREGVLVDHLEEAGLPPLRCSELTVDEAGGVWAAGRDGLVRVWEGQVRVLTAAHGLPGDFINAIVPDGEGAFWMDFNRGIVRVDQTALIALTQGEASTLEYDLFEGPEAFRTSEKIAFTHSGCRTGDGRVWFPSARGVVAIDPTDLPPPPPPPPVTIRRVWINGHPFDPDDPIEVSPGPGALQVDFIALNYLAPQNVRYRYRLLGLEHGWFEVRNRRSAYFTNLPPGRYRFEVQATTTEGEWKGPAAALAFVLPQRFYETAPFLLAVGVLLVALLSYAARFWQLRRERSLLWAAQGLLEEKVRVRTAELAEANHALHDEIDERRRAQIEAERLQEELRRAAQEAQRATETKSQFLAHMSHEIRTPMNAVIGMTNLLLDTALRPDQREFAEVSRNSAEALLTILNDILDLSKVEAGKLTLRRGTFDPRRVTEGVCELLKVRAHEKGLALRCALGTGLPLRWNGDSTRLRQVLLNLAGNAIKFTEEGSVTVRVRCAETATSDGPGARLRFEVEDTGAGLSPEEQARLFQPFSQIDNTLTRRHGGTGLGLAISRQIVELMGGEIGVFSAAGSGSLFWFEIPPGESPEPLLEPGPEDAGEADPDVVLPDRLATLRILVAEDHEVNRRVIELQLRKLGTRPDFAENGRAALEALRGRPYDLVFMDCEMPEMDGYEATQRWRREGGSQTVIIALTAHAMEGDRDRCLAAGMDVFLSKPVREAALRRTLKEACELLESRTSGSPEA